jgi:hypothetical protein
MEARTAALLYQAFNALARSLLQYGTESAPWADHVDQEVYQRLYELAGQERQALARLGRLLSQHHLPPPHPGPYPERYTAWNYVAVDRLLPHLLAEQQRLVAELERALAQASDPAGRDALKELLQLKRQHLAVLQDLAQVHTHAGVRV